MRSGYRRLLKIFHPEGIPRIGAALYNTVSKSEVFEYQYDLVLEDLAEPPPREKLLDIGTGPGRLPLKLIRRFPDLHPIGVDISEAMVLKARDNIEKAGLRGRIDIIEADARHLPFVERSIGTVIATGSLHHWKDPVGSLDEIHRVLVPGGRALIYDIVTDTPRESLEAVGRRFGNLRTALFRLHALEEPFYSVEDLCGLMRSSSFGEGETSFVGILCRMNLRKKA